MPKYHATDPDSGRTVTLEGDSPPTEQELEQVFAAIQKPKEATPPPANSGQSVDFLKNFQEQNPYTGIVPVVEPKEGPHAMEQGSGDFIASVAKHPIQTVGEIAGLPFKAAGAAVAEIAREQRDQLINPTLRSLGKKPIGTGPSFVIDERTGEMRPPTAQEKADRDPIQSGKPLYVPRGTMVNPDGGDAQRLLSRWTTPEGIVSFPLAMTTAGAAAMLVQMVPGLMDQAAGVIKGEGTEIEKRDRMNDLFALAALVVGPRGAKAVKEGMSPKAVEQSEVSGQVEEGLRKAFEDRQRLKEGAISVGENWAPATSAALAQQAEIPVRTGNKPTPRRTTRPKVPEGPEVRGELPIETEQGEDIPAPAGEEQPGMGYDDFVAEAKRLGPDKLKTKADVQAAFSGQKVSRQAAAALGRAAFGDDWGNQAPTKPQEAPEAKTDVPEQAPPPTPQEAPKAQEQAPSEPVVATYTTPDGKDFSVETTREKAEASKADAESRGGKVTITPVKKGAQDANPKQSAVEVPGGEPPGATAQVAEGSAPEVGAAPGAQKAQEKVAPKAKEPWEMTQDEWNANTRFYRSGKTKNAQTPTGERVILRDEATPKTHTQVSADFYKRLRRIAVIKALSEGKTVPPEVLEDFPNLNPKESATPSAPVKTAQDFAKESGFTFENSQSVSTEGMPPEMAAKMPKPVLRFTDKRPPGESPTSGLSFQAPEGSTKDQIQAAFDKAKEGYVAPTTQPEKITAAAYRDPATGKISTGPHHHAALESAGGKDLADKYPTRDSRNTDDFGYASDRRPFIPRSEAAPIIEKSGQKLEEFDVDETGKEQPHSDQVAAQPGVGKPLSEAPQSSDASSNQGATPADAAAKVADQVNEVAKTEGQRPAKEVKSELLKRLDDAMHGAPKESDYSEPKHGFVEINIPGDGDFKVPNHLAALAEIRDRVKAISTTKGTAPKVPTMRGPREAFKLGDGEGNYTSGDVATAESQQVKYTEALRGKKNKTPLSQLVYDKAVNNDLGKSKLYPTIQHLADAISPTHGTVTVGQAKIWLEARVRQTKRLVESSNSGDTPLSGPGSPSAKQGPDTGGGGFQDQSGRDIYGIAQRVREQRAQAGQVSPIPTGEGVETEQAVKWGQDLISMGVNPEKSMQEFERTKATSFDLFALVRAQGESLAKTAQSIEETFGTDSPQYRMAQQALTDWDTRVKVMQTEWSNQGKAQQGQTDIDTGSFTGLSRAYREITRKDLNPTQVNTAKRLAKGVSEANKAVDTAKPKLDAAIDKLPEEGVPRPSPYILDIAEKIVKKLESRADAARARMRARAMTFSAGVDPTVIMDLADIGTAHIARWGLDFAKWSDGMIKELGPKLADRLKEMGSSLEEVFEKSKAIVQSEGDSFGPKSDDAMKIVTKTGPKSKIPTDINEQRKVFDTYESGKPLTPTQVKTLWKRARTDYIDKGNEDLGDIVYKLASDFGIPVKDVLRGLNQNREVRRAADNVWAKQRQAKMLKQAAKRWIENAEETWLQKAMPLAARLAFSAKVGLHGTVATGTHAPLVAATHPAIFANNFGKMYKLVFSPDYYNIQKSAMTRRPNFILANRSGLVNDMSKMEDFNDPKLAEGFPKMAEWFKSKLGKLSVMQGMGTRGYSVLKILRQDLFDHEWDSLPDAMKNGPDGKISQQGSDIAKAIADSVNHITGVTKSSGGAIGEQAHYAFFAPKLEASRVAVIATDPLRAVNSMLKMQNMTPAEKWFAVNQIKEKAKIFATASGLLLANQALNSLFGDDKKINGVPEFLGGGGWDPMASDFMKFRGAGMKFAWGSPFLTMMRLPLRIIQIGMGNGGKSRFLIYPDESMGKEALRYVRSQLSPLAQPIVSLVTKADYQDRPLPQIPGYGPPPPMPKRLAKEGVEPYTWKEFGSEVVLPIPFEEGAKEVFEHGFGGTPEQHKAYIRAFVTILAMSATGGRLSEDQSQ